MNKTVLVALREYLENLRTKTFWIGIAVLPFILILWFVAVFWLEKAKDIREYAVIDHSGWLLEAVEKNAAFPDLEKVFQATVEKYKKGGRDFEKLPEVLRKMAPFLSKIEDQELQFIASQAADAMGPEGLAKIESADLPEDLKAQAKREFLKYREEIREWWLNLPPKEANQYGSGLAKGRYVRIGIDSKNPDILAELNRKIADEKLFAYFVIGEDPMAGSWGCKYVSKNLTDTDLKDWFSLNATAVVRSRRIDQAGIDEEVAKKIREPFTFEAKKISAEGEEEEVKAEDKVRQWAPAVFTYILWISIMTIAQMLLSSTVEEKSNKTIEVLLSSVSPLQLMAGKIIGIAGTGLTILFAWIVFFFAEIKIIPHLFSEMPKIDLSVIASEPIYLLSFLAYFILGYMFLSAFLVGIGSVCSSLKEAQNLMSPITIILIIPLLALGFIPQDPNGTLARILSYIPPFTPFIMMNRAAGPPSPYEYVATTVLLLFSIAVALWAAAKIFRIGILMTGKPPRLIEILKWVRAPVGQIQPRQKK